MAVTQFTTAPAGSGKSYGRCARFIAHEWLPHETGDIWSNYPIHVDAMVEYVHKRHPHLDPDTLRDRIRLIPQDVLAEWKAGKSTPAAFFKGVDLGGAHIAIDEIHNFCHRNSKPQLLQEWREWLGELRHCGATFECLSQVEMKVHKLIRDEASLQRSMFNVENKPDPFFGILMHDWYQLRARFITGEYTSTIIEACRIESMGKKVEVKELARSYPLTPELYPLYDSYSTPIAGGTKAKGKVHPFQTKTRRQLLGWFLRRNAWQLFTRLAVLALAIWLCFFGGVTWTVRTFLGTLETAHAVAAPSSAAGAAPAAAATPAPAPGKPSAAGPAGADPFGQPATSKESKRIAELEAKVAEREKEIEKVKTDAARFCEIVALFGRQVTLRCGITIDVGEQIPIGPLKGRTIKGISHEKRRVILDDNTVLPLAP